jgi:hypothetical protein
MNRARTMLTVWTLIGTLLGACGSDGSPSSSGTGAGNHGGSGGGISLGGGGKGGNAGAGGATTMGGAGGGGMGGTNGTVRPECQLPACFDVLQTLPAECQPMGSCMEQSSAGGAMVNICWANGVKENVSITVGAGDAMASAQVRTKSGTLCFSLDFSIDPTTGDSGPITFRDSSGKAIGSIEGNADGSAVVTCAGQAPKTIPASCGMDMGSMMPGMAETDCTPGVCQ